MPNGWIGAKSQVLKPLTDSCVTCKVLQHQQQWCPTRQLPINRFLVHLEYISTSVLEGKVVQLPQNHKRGGMVPVLCAPHKTMSGWSDTLFPTFGWSRSTTPAAMLQARIRTHNHTARMAVYSPL
jgi:hypothetical protein